MRLFNTLTQQIEPLDGVDRGVSLYVCGITPYDTTHLGHAFINVVYDSLVRYLRWRGVQVTYVQNVTDIDDDILRKSRELGMTWDSLGHRETDRYLSDLAALHVAPPDHYVRASEETATMIELIQTLLARDLAYVHDGWVYFCVQADPQFGKLADAAGYVGYEQWLATANERGNFPDDPRKADPLDFVLWQAQQPGEPAWPSPWGDGRPGWHIECSAMAVKYIGPQVTIHGGGSDLVFPHHTCEIAQSENATGQHPFVHTWMHCAMVCYEGEKMSKSLGNLVLVRDLLPTYTPDAIRVMLLSHPYRQVWEYDEADMQRAAALAERLRHAADAAPTTATPGSEPDLPARQARMEFVAALENDFQTARALASLDTFAGQIATSGTPAQVATLRELAGVLGLTLDAAPPTSAK